MQTLPPEPTARALARGAAAVWSLGAVALLAAGAAQLAAVRGAPAPGAGEVVDLAAHTGGLWSRGVPAPVWFLPFYAALAVLSWIGGSPGLRGARARGTVVGVAALLAGWASAWPAAGAGSASPELHLGVVLSALTAAALALRAGARPLPAEGLDLFAAGGVGVFVMATSFQLSVIGVDRVLRVPVAPVDEGQLQLPLQALPGESFDAPAAVRDVPVDRFDPRWGAPAGGVDVVAFLDAPSDAGRAVSHQLAALRQRYGDRARFIWKQYPLDTACNSRIARTVHPGSCLQAKAVLCAQDQGRFWEMEARVAGAPDGLSEEQALAAAADLGLRVDRFKGCLMGPGIQEQLTEDVSHAGYLGITTTPQVFVAGREVPKPEVEGRIEAVLRAVLDGDPSPRLMEVRWRPDVPAPPAGLMQMLPVGSAWMDPVEASVSADGAAVAWAGAEPARASWSEASAACASAGKRLCRAEEWWAACAGPAGAPWPTGPRPAPGVCRADPGELGPTGTRGACRSAGGPLDLVGNVAEWVGDSPDSAALAGGAAGDGDRARCDALRRPIGMEYVDLRVGFRCCSDVPVQAAGAPAPQPPAAGRPGDTLPSALWPGPGGPGLLVVSAAGCDLCGAWAREIPDLLPADVALLVVHLGEGPAPPGARLDPAAASSAHLGLVELPLSLWVGPDGVILDRVDGFQRTRLTQILAGGPSAPPGP